MREPDIRCEWGTFTSSSYCGRQAVWQHGSGVFCDEHSTWVSTSRRELLCRDPRPVSIFCGALAGALDNRFRAVIADYIAHGDPSPLLDLAEQRGLHEGGYGPERYEEWAELDAHGTGDNPHVWLPVPNGVHVWHDYGDGAVTLVESDLRQCPCGQYEHQDTGFDFGVRNVRGRIAAGSQPALTDWHRSEDLTGWIGTFSALTSAIPSA